MAPLKSSLSKSVGKLLGVFRDRDLSLRGLVQSSRYIIPITPISATGGVTSGGITPGNGYRYHVFISPGTFTISSGNDNVEYLVVAGGGAGPGDPSGGGAGAGGLRTNATGSVDNGGGPIVNSPLTLGSGTYPITVGTGRAAATSDPRVAPAIPSQNSIFTNPFGTPIVANGGGAGAWSGPNPGPQIAEPGTPGGSGGADGGTGNVGGFPIAEGYPGSPGGGGGGGAGGAGTSTGGGPGATVPAFAAPLISPQIPAPIQPSWIPAVGPTGLYAGGGGGSSSGSTPGPGGGGSGDSDAYGSNGTPGVSYTGGGGGAGWGFPPPNTGYSGGPGIVVIRYLE